MSLSACRQYRMVVVLVVAALQLGAQEWAEVAPAADVAWPADQLQGCIAADPIQEGLHPHLA